MTPRARYVSLIAATKAEMIEQLHAMSDLGYSQFSYIYQLGHSFTALCLLEEEIIAAMLMCDRIRVRSVLGPEEKAWKAVLEKKTTLEDSTLGNLIKILKPHVLESDIRYLTFLKEKRDVFVHRFFRASYWPGEIEDWNAQVFIRRVLALGIIFSRGGDRIWGMFARNGLLQVHLSDDKFRVMTNPGALDELLVKKRP